MNTKLNGNLKNNSCAKKAMWQIRVKQHLEDESKNPSREIEIVFQINLRNYMKINSI